jgi:hypothetical protein
MKLSHLLAKRTDLLREVRLANIAFAYDSLSSFAARVDRARLQGRVLLKPLNPDEERFLPMLIALDGNQSVIEEHFSEDDLILLSDVVGFATGHPGFELTFRIEELGEFIASLRAELLHFGVALDGPNARVAEESNQS